MDNDLRLTYFAPAERATDEVVARDGSLFTDDLNAQIFLNAVPDVFIILNPERQIVFANQTLPEMLGLAANDLLLGQRPGEALRCTHAHDHVSGCGTSEACRTCGAVQAILKSQQGQVATEECHIAQESGDALDLRVRATPVVLQGRKFTLYAIQDIRHEKRRKALERIFFMTFSTPQAGSWGLPTFCAAPTQRNSKPWQPMFTH